MTTQQETMVLPPALAAALSPGEPGTKAPPTAKSLPGLRKRFLEEIGDYLIVAFLPEPMKLKPPETRPWIEAAMDTADARMLGLLIARVREKSWYSDDAPNVDLVHWLTLQHGLGVAFDALLYAERWRASKGATLPGLYLDWPVPDSLSARVTQSLWAFRSHWMRAPQAERLACMERLHALGAQLPMQSRAHFAIVLPEARPLAAQLWSEATPELQETSSAWVRWAAGRPLDDIEPGFISSWRGEPKLYAVLICEHGLQLLPRFLNPSLYADSDLAWYLAAYDTPEATLALVRHASKYARCAEALAWVCTHRPESALAPLAQVLGEGKLPKGGAARLTPNLKAVAALLGERLPERMDALSPVAREVLAPFATQSAVPTDTFAPRDQWPAALAEPPWTRKKKPKPKTHPGLAVQALARTVEGESSERARQLLRRAERHCWSMRETAVSLAKLLPGWDADRLLALEQHPQDLAVLIEDWRHHGVTPRHAVHEPWPLADPVCLTLWNEIGSEHPEPEAGAYVLRFGGAAVPGLLKALRAELSRGVTYQFVGAESVFSVASRVGAAEIAPLMAQLLATRPSSRTLAHQWLLRFPAHAVAGLLPDALGEDGRPQQHARAALRALVRAGKSDEILAGAVRYQDAEVLASTQAFLAQDPIDNVPARLNANSKLPPFWNPAGWRRPRLVTSGNTLPDEALHVLGLWMSFSADPLYGSAGLDAVRQACDPQSLADFAWDAFQSWEASGASAASSWALQVLGCVGTGDTARLLAARVRQWSAPGGGTATRIDWALEALGRMGSDVALLQLDAIARTNRQEKVRLAARQKLVEVAERLGLAADELEDRLVPDLGLGASGHLVLDFGPRQFRVDFDEHLNPYWRELVAGQPATRLAGVPRKGPKDDAELATAALNRFKALKQDLALIADLQPRRLERAMRTGRTWSLSAFRRYLAEHALMRHLARRLVWGVLAPNGGGGEALESLHATFRVSAEGEWVDADDMPLAMDWPEDAAIVVAHPLQLSAPLIAAYAGQFADYELIQPFDQLRRVTATPSPEERSLTKLNRWTGQQVEAGPLWGLQARSWTRVRGGGEAFSQVRLELPGARWAMLDFEPGLHNRGDNERQTLGSVTLSCPCDELAPIAFSEMVRDLDSLTERK